MNQQLSELQSTVHEFLVYILDNDCAANAVEQIALRLSAILHVPYCDIQFALIAPPDSLPIEPRIERVAVSSRLSQPLYDHSTTITILEKEQPLESLDGLRVTSMSGPFDINKLSFDSTLALLCLNCGSSTAVFLVTIVIPKDFNNAFVGSRLLTFCTTLATVFSLSYSSKEVTKTHNARLAFYNDLFNHVVLRPQEAFRHVCHIWCTLFQANWAWLWLYNGAPGAKEWELASVYTLEPLPTSSRTRYTLSNHSILQASYDHGRPLYIRDVNSPIAIDGREYSVQTRASLNELGCTSFICIPVTVPVAATASGVKAAICLHYKNNLTPPPFHPHNTITLMSRVTAFFLLDSFEKTAFECLKDLNAATHLALSDGIPSPRYLLENFSRRIIKHITQYLNVRYVSLFCDVDEQGQFVCTATTGIYKQGLDAPIPNAQIHDAVYDARAHATSWTITALSRSEITVYPVGSPLDVPARHTPVWSETPPQDASNQHALIIAPICINESATQRRRCLGVLRVSAPMGMPDGSVNYSKNFDSFQILLLSFIVQQIATTLHATFVGIQESRSVSRLRHDMLTPSGNLYADTLELDEASKTSQLAFDEVATLISRLPHTSGNERRVAIRNELLRHCLMVGPPAQIDSLRLTLNNLAIEASHILTLVAQLGGKASIAELYKPIPIFIEGQIIARLKRSFGPIARDRQRRIFFESLRDKVPKLKVDPVMIERVFTNLIDNAIKYGDAGSDINIKCDADSSGYTFTVESVGIPLTKEECEQVFHGEYRSPLARKRADGQGFGLKISREMAVAHGGRLWAESSEGKTRMKLWLPLNLAF